MIEPKADDIGRSVVYRPAIGRVEYGVITSFNALFVFVRYGSEPGGKATLRVDLDWPVSHGTPLTQPRV